MEELYRGIGTGFDQAPTLKSVRSQKNLQQAFNEVNRRLVGCDGFPLWAYRRPHEYVRLDPNFGVAYPDLKPLETIQENLLFNAYPDPVLNKKTPDGRTIQVGTVRNAIIAGAFARKLNLHFNKYFSDSSCAFRIGRRPEQIISDVKSKIRQGNYFVLKSDVKNFFPSVIRWILYLQLDDSISDKELIAFIFEIISPVQLPESTILHSGLPTGSSLSPVLSNLYLHRLDLAFSSLLYFRYVDDILILGEAKHVVERAKEYLESSLFFLGLRLNQEKTGIYDLRRESVNFLGYMLRGGNVYPSRKSEKNLETRLRIWGQKARLDPGPANRSKLSIMKGFVRRFRNGTVYQTFRRIDRRIQGLYPEGVTLVRLWREGGERFARGTNSACTRGTAACCPTEKAHKGQVPTVGSSWGVKNAGIDSPAPIGASDGQ